MKVTGYKIKEAIKGFERLLEDTPLVGVVVPLGHGKTGRENLVSSANDLNRSFLILQMLRNKILNLKKLQQEYNSKVKVNENTSLADAIQSVSYPSQMITSLTALLSQVTYAEEYGVKHNRAASEKSLDYPEGRKPSTEEPVIAKELLQSIIRKFKTDETKIKNLIGYGNGVEIDVACDESLLDENSWNNFDPDLEILNSISSYDLFGGKVIFPNGLVLDPKEMEVYAFSKAGFTDGSSDIEMPNEDVSNV